MRPLPSDPQGLRRWAARAERRHPLAVVLGSSVTALSFARSLGRHGVGVAVVDDGRDVAMASRFARSVVLPSIREHDEAWLDFLDRLASVLERRAALFVTSDETVVFVAEHADELAVAYRFVVPTRECVRRVVDKRSQHELAMEVGVPVPRTFWPQSAEELESVLPEIRLPCILKPCSSHLARRQGLPKAYLVESLDELKMQHAALATSGLAFMVQEVISGEDSQLAAYLGFWDEQGRERAFLAKRKLRQCPPHFGVGSFQVTEESAEAVSLARRLLLRLGYRGYVTVEFKRDQRDGILRLVEINPRAVTGNQLAVTAGVDLPWLGYRNLVMGDQVEPSNQVARPGVKWVHEEWDLGSFLALRREGRITLLEWLRSLRGCEAKALAAWDDPLPLLVTLRRMASTALRKLTG